MCCMMLDVDTFQLGDGTLTESHLFQTVEMLCICVVV